MHDMNQAMAVLAAMHHWRIQTHNRHGARSGYECTIWNGGRRVTGHSNCPLGAILRAVAKLKEPRKRSRPKKAAWTPTFVGE